MTWCDSSPRCLDASEWRTVGTASRLATAARIASRAYATADESGRKPLGTRVLTSNQLHELTDPSRLSTSRGAPTT
jgi:hypothetical protein